MTTNDDKLREFLALAETTEKDFVRVIKLMSEAEEAMRITADAFTTLTKAINNAFETGNIDPGQKLPITRISSAGGATHKINDNDNLYPSAWFTQGKGKQLRIELGKLYRVTQVVLRMHVPNERFYYIDYEESGNSAFKSDPDDSAVYTINIMEKTDEITLTFNGNSTNDWNGVYSMSVFGFDNVEQPSPEITDWPKPASGISFRNDYNALQGAELFKQGFGFVRHFQYRYGTSGRSVDVRSQSEFTAARRNPDIGVIRWAGDVAPVLLDEKTEHDQVQLFICQHLNHIKTWGNLVIHAALLNNPGAKKYNVVAHGSNVLLSISTDVVQYASWEFLAWINPPGETIENVIMQGGHFVMDYAPGAEKVQVVAPCWINDFFPDEYAKRGRKPWDLRSKHCGVQGSVGLNPGADWMQTVLHPDKQGTHAGAPHAKVFHENTIFSGMFVAVQQALWGEGHGEQALDHKASSGSGLHLMSDCIVAGFMQNHIGSNSAHGDAVGTHYESDHLVMQRNLIYCQRGAELGSGDGNTIRNNYFASPGIFDSLAVQNHKRDPGKYNKSSGGHNVVVYGSGSGAFLDGNVFEGVAINSAYSGAKIGTGKHYLVSQAERETITQTGIDLLPIGTKNKKANPLWRV